MARHRPSSVGVHDGPPDARSLVAPERDIRTGRPGTLDRNDKGRQRPTEPRVQHSAGVPRRLPWLVGAGLVACALVVGGFIVMAGGDDEGDAAPGSAAAAEAASGVAAAITESTAERPETGPASETAVTTIAGDAGSPATTAEPLPTTTTTIATTTTAVRGGAGVYNATSTSNGWTWLYTPAPPGFDQAPPYGAETRWPQPGEVDAQPATVTLVGPCDGSGPCALEQSANPLASFISQYTFRASALQPTGDGGYQVSSTEPGGWGDGDCGAGLSAYSYELALRPAAEGWTGTSITHLAFSTHADVTYGENGSSYTVCDGFDFSSTFLLERQA